MANYKKFITLLLIFSIHMMPFNLAHASTLGGWTITQQIAQGASTIINATKSGIENGVNIVKTSTAKITPNASQVAKVLRGGLYGYAISVALEQILGFVVDWTLEPENNRISYIPPGSIVYQSTYAGMDNSIKYYSFTSFCSAAFQAAQTYYNGATSYTIVGSSCRVNYGDSGAYDNVPYTSSQEQEEKRYVSLDTIAAQVISNAESETDEQKKAGAQDVTTAAAQDMLANDASTQSDVETQLNANAKTQTSEQAQGNTKPNESNPDITDISLSFPVFCGWAPIVCQAANVVINFPITLTDWWNRSTTALTEAYTFAKTKVQEFSDIFKDEPQTDTELEFNDPTDDITDTSVSFSSSCPPPIVLADFNFHGIPIHWELDFSVWCDSLSTYLKPIVISMASFSAVLILGGVRENG
ncbi:MAG: hypothetical protein A2003_03125 [Acinetobacter sp. GWC1_38_13]|uniref:virulence factor TspB C-terminal domain-related protein n=1 Tax=Acinetobacter sp. GWC1_38_13 TaxID=1797234 RepID=UPI0008C4D702|nr:virulence factor TspB C-terminal domain-related protein [Acinetobacter sp. GWC1_38_13]OFW45029.1 MAG: hypothetical protein A2003_03125 [Acinetobacter sp. GWC1_38_13]HAV57160.1 hypothetical protein [Acinetobacter junii]